MLDIMAKITRKKGPTAGSVAKRKELTQKLYELEHPETRGEESLKQQVASAELSDVSTKRFFRNYKSAAKQQWINKVGVAEWKEGVEPEFTGVTKKPKDVPEELAKFWQMIYWALVYLH